MCVDVVSKKLIDQINVCEQHTTAAVSVAAQLVKSLRFRDARSEKILIRLPQVRYHLPASETTDRNDHITTFAF